MSEAPTPTNTQRAAWTTAALHAHAQAMAAEGFTLPETSTDADKAQAVLTDLMCFCDHSGIDFDDLLNLADLDYQNS